MAAAALEVLGLLDDVAEVTPVELMAVDVMVPQVGQGAVAVECRRRRLRHPRPPRRASSTDRPGRRSTCERAFLAELGSGCSLPVGAHAGRRRRGRARACARSWPVATGIYEGVHEGTADEAHAWAAEAAGLARQAVGAVVTGRGGGRAGGQAVGRLSGRTVVIARAAEQAGRLRALLEAEGAAVVEVPTIAIEPPADGDGALREALRDLWDWVVVTSPNGAERAVARGGRPSRRAGPAVGRGGPGDR